MSTPSEGPGAWQQGSFYESAEWLSNLSPVQQQNLVMVANMTPEQAEKLNRFLNKEPLKARAHAAVGQAVGRVHGLYQQARQRLSDAAQSLASQANQYRQTAVDRATQAGQQIAATYRDTRDAVVDRATQAGQQVAATYRDTRDAVVDRANQAGQQIAGTYRGSRDAVVGAAQRGQQAASQAWQQGTARAATAGQAAVSGAQQAYGAAADRGRQAVDAGQRLAGRVSRWAQDRWNGAQLRAEAGMAAITAFKHDPTQPNVLSAKEKLELSGHFNRILNAPNAEAYADAAKALNDAAQAKVQQSNMARALGGVAPAAQAVGQPQQTASTEQSNQGAQPGAGLNKPDKGNDNIGR